MRIGIDIDGVLTDLDRFSYDYFSKFCVENNIDYKIGQSDYEIAKTFGLGKNEDDAFWERYLDFYAKKVKARSFAGEVLKKLKQDGHEIFIVTARWLTNRDDKLGENMRRTVKNWLKKNKIKYDKLIFTRAANEEKLDEIKEFALDLMIEDSPKNVTQLSSFIKVICFDASYNKNCSGDNIIRCYSWFDAYKIISDLKEK